MATIYFVRHGETALNVGEERIRGWSNPPLDEHGKKQAHDVAHKLNMNITGKTAQIYTGDFDRCRDTATEIHNALRAPVTEMQELRPWNVGEFTGKPTKKVMPQLIQYARESDKPVPQGEAFMEFVLRFLNGLRLITHAAMVTAPEPVVMVSHTRNARVMLAWTEGGLTNVFRQPPSDYLSKAEDPVQPGNYIKFEWKRGQWRAESENGNR